MVDKEAVQGEGGSRAGGGASSTRKRARSPSSSESPNKRKAQGGPSSNGNDTNVANGTSSRKGKQRSATLRNARGAAASTNGDHGEPLTETATVLSIKEEDGSGSEACTDVKAGPEAANGVVAPDQPSSAESAEGEGVNGPSAPIVKTEETASDFANADPAPPAAQDQDTNNQSSAGSPAAFPDGEERESRETLLAQVKILERRLQAAERASALHTRALNGLYERCNCDVCFELMTRPCIVAPCGHMACRECLVAYWKQPALDEGPIAAGLSEAARADQQRRRTIRRAKRCPVCRTESTRPPAEAWLMKQIVGDVERWKSGEDREATQEIVRRSREDAAEAERRRQERTRREAGPSRSNASHHPNATSLDGADNTESKDRRANPPAEPVAKVKKEDGRRQDKGKDKEQGEAVPKDGLDLFVWSDEEKRPDTEEEGDLDIFPEGPAQSQASQADIVASVRAEREAQMGEETWTDIFAEEDDAFAMRWDHQDGVFRCPRCMQELIDDDECDHCQIRLRRPAGEFGRNAEDLAGIRVRRANRRGYAADSDPESYLVTDSNPSEVEIEDPWTDDDGSDEDDFYVDDLHLPEAFRQHLQRLGPEYDVVDVDAPDAGRGPVQLYPFIVPDDSEDEAELSEFSGELAAGDFEPSTDQEEESGDDVHLAGQTGSDDDGSDLSADVWEAMHGFRRRHNYGIDDEGDGPFDAHPDRRFDLEGRTSAELEDMIARIDEEELAAESDAFDDDDDDDDDGGDSLAYSVSARDRLAMDLALAESGSDLDEEDPMFSYRQAEAQPGVQTRARRLRRPIVIDSDDADDDEDGGGGRDGDGRGGGRFQIAPASDDDEEDGYEEDDAAGGEYGSYNPEERAYDDDEEEEGGGY